MLRVALHHLVIALTVLAFFGGMTLQSMPPAAAFAGGGAAKTDSDCPHMGMQHRDAGTPHLVPSKGMDAECIKQMGCLGIASLPLRPPAPAVPFVYNKVAYSVWALLRAGRSIEPDLLPPIGM